MLRPQTSETDLNTRIT